MANVRLNFSLACAAFFISCNWTHPVIAPPEPVPVVVNEFMASNGAGVYLDEKNEADDWIELYNKGKNPVSLKGLYLSDDSAKLDKFPLPDTIVPSRGFVVIWADNQKDQGRLHASFKLSSQNGEEIILTQGEKTIIDRVLFLPSEVKSDESFGRWTDGAETWAKQVLPTPGKTNSGGRFD